jgi:membrane protein
MIYYFAPDAEQDWVWLTPGSVLSSTLWLLASLAFRYYVVNISSYAATYGALGGVMVLMLWFYISGAAILLGAEMNAEIEHASPYGKEPGEKVPGQRRVIGSAAMRAWFDKRRGRGAKPPSAIPASPKLRSSGGGDWLLGITVVVAQFWMTLRALRKTRG